MAPDCFNLKLVCMKATIIALFTVVLSGNTSQAGGFDNLLPERNRPFSAMIRTGIGTTTSNTFLKGENKYRTGALFSLQLGYQVSKRFSLEFGPAFWLAASDLFSSTGTGNTKPVDQRTFITINGVYKCCMRWPVEIRLGGGVGNFVYTPKDNLVSAETARYADTEVLTGFTGTAGVCFPVKLFARLDIRPAINFWYMDLRSPQLSYLTAVDHSRPSLTADAELQFRFHF